MWVLYICIDRVGNLVIHHTGLKDEERMFKTVWRARPALQLREPLKIHFGCEVLADGWKYPGGRLSLQKQLLEVPLNICVFYFLLAGTVVGFANWMFEKIAFTKSGGQLKFRES